MGFEKNILPEIIVRTSRSSGPGGQNVNKVSSRVEMRFHVANSVVLSDEEKGILMERLKNRIGADGCLRVSCQRSRSQWKNRETCFDKLLELIGNALEPIKPRKETGPTPVSIVKRAEQKKAISEKKQLRKRPEV